MSPNEEIEKVLEIRDEKMEKKRKRTAKKEKAKPVKKLTKKEQQIREIANNTVLPDHYFTIWTEVDLRKMVGWLNEQEIIAVDTETMGTNPFIDEIVGISLYAPHRGFYIPLKHIEDIRDAPVEEGQQVGVDYVRCLPKDVVAAALKPLLEDRSKKFILHNCKFDQHILRNWMGINLIPYFDTMIAQALLDENQSKKLKDMATYYLKIPADRFSTLFGNVTFDKVPIKINPHTRTGNLATYYAVKDTELTYKMYEFQIKNLNRPNLEQIKKLFFEVEMPFSQIVLEAERRGVRMDIKYLENVVAKQLYAELEELRQKIWHYTGEINLKSPAQLAVALYDKLNLPRVNTKKPNSTDKKTLKMLKKEHEVISLILDFRSKAKLVDAFADKLPKAVINGRVHTSFNTVGARSGRMSSSNPKRDWGFVA